MLKKFILGFLCATLLLGAPKAIASVQDIIVQKANFDVLIDGQAYDGDLPVLNYGGNTYIPLRTFADMIGSAVKWDGENVQVKTPFDTPVNNSFLPNDEKIAFINYKGMDAIIYNDYFTYVSINDLKEQQGLRILDSLPNYTAPYKFRNYYILELGENVFTMAKYNVLESITINYNGKQDMYISLELFEKYGQ